MRHSSLFLFAIACTLVFAEGCATPQSCLYTRADGSQYREDWMVPSYQAGKKSVKVIEKEQTILTGSCM